LNAESGIWDGVSVGGWESGEQAASPGHPGERARE
jgi:hypothetical protein